MGAYEEMTGSTLVLRNLSQFKAPALEAGVFCSGASGHLSRASAFGAKRRRWVAITAAFAIGNLGIFSI